MRCRYWIAGIVSGLTMLGHAGEPFYVVELSDLDKSETLEVMSRTELKQTEKRYSLESRIYRKALTACLQEWKADENNEGISFPSGKLGPRKVRTKGTYKSAEDAQERVEVLQERARRVEEPKKKYGKQPKKYQKSKDKLAKEKAREADRAAATVQAKAMLSAKLEELLAPPPTETGEAL